MVELTRFEKIDSSLRNMKYVASGQEFSLMWSSEFDVYFIGDKSSIYAGSDKTVLSNDKYAYKRLVRKLEKLNNRGTTTQENLALSDRSYTRDREFHASVSCGPFQLSIVDNGKVYVWGNSERGKLGLPPPEMPKPQPGQSNLPPPLPNYVVEEPVELYFNPTWFEVSTGKSSVFRDGQKKMREAVLMPIQDVQLTVKNLPKTLQLINVYNEDNNLSNYFDNIASKFIGEWRRVREINFKYKVFLKLFLQIIFKKGKEKIKHGLAKNSEAINPFLRNIMLYQKLFGILYLQPYYLYKLLINPKFAEGEKIFKLIKELYIKSTASPRKNLTYLMSMCLTLLNNDKQLIVKHNLQATVLEMYCLKTYNLIIMSNCLISDYFEDLKHLLLSTIVTFATWRLDEASRVTEEKLKTMVSIKRTTSYSPGSKLELPIDQVPEEQENMTLERDTFIIVL